MRKLLHVLDGGIIPYKEAWDLQQQLLDENVEQKKNNTLTKHYLLLCEHPSVYTIGKNGNMNHLLMSNQELKKKKIDFFHTNRGGDITFHGLGQFIAYPILDLEQIGTDIGKYLRALEQVIIHLLTHFGLKSERSPKETGVWLDSQTQQARKICAIGIKLSRWITMHGLALNVSTDLRYFDFIIPCGIKNKSVTSMSQELKRKVDIKTEVFSLFIDLFAKVFDFDYIVEPVYPISSLHLEN